MIKSVIDLQPGKNAKILEFANAKVADVFESMGLFVGQMVQVIYKSGTVVISVNHRMIAMSRVLAERIYVSL
ncbi:MAG: ferrous iron transport protein A [Holosporales bacterium]|nr:ferrous iron transport protein A [Holosporales bacterium]